MRLTFVSNYFNHHQRPLCDALAAEEDVEFCFLQVEPMEEERVRMGWGLDIARYPYVRLYHANAEASRRLVMESDAVIFGGVDDESYILPRLEAGGLTLRYSERIYKEGQWKFLSPRGLRKKYHDHIRFRRSPVWLLCAGAYVASDYSLIHAYPGKKLVWGYFPEVISYPAEELHAKRRRNPRLELLWSGRMLDWKRPEQALLVAEALEREGVDYHLSYVGGGEREEALRQRVRELGLTERVSFAGFLTPEEVRGRMRQADIYLFTSSYLEGWGASVNEAMNSGCAVVASHAAGAVPYLLRHGENGLVYRGVGGRGGGAEELCALVRQLAAQPDERERLGTRAYETIAEHWRAEDAAARLAAWLRGALAGDPDGEAAGVREDAAGTSGVDSTRGAAADALPLPLQAAPLLRPGAGYAYTRRGK